MQPTRLTTIRYLMDPWSELSKAESEFTVKMRPLKNLEEKVTRLHKQMVQKMKILEETIRKNDECIFLLETIEEANLYKIVRDSRATKDFPDYKISVCVSESDKITIDDMLQHSRHKTGIIASFKSITCMKEAWMDIREVESEYSAETYKLKGLEEEVTILHQRMVEMKEKLDEIIQDNRECLFFLDSVQEAEFYKTVRASRLANDLSDYRISNCVSESDRIKIKDMLRDFSVSMDVVEPPFKRMRRNEINTGHWSLKKDVDDDWDDWDTWK